MTATLSLCYHAVSERWPAVLSVRPDRFEHQMGVLARRGFRSLTFTQAACGRPLKRGLAITFDDGYRSVIGAAKPILDHHGMVATVFVPTRFVGANAMSWPGIDRWTGAEHEAELAPLSWSELEDLAAAGWEVGSHTQSHPHLTRLGDEELAAELSDSRAEIEARLGSCASLAYPFGDHDARVVAAAREAGYAAAGTLHAGASSVADPHTFPRTGIYRRDDDPRFWLKVSPTIRRLRGLAARRLRTPRSRSGNRA